MGDHGSNKGWVIIKLEIRDQEGEESETVTKPSYWTRNGKEYKNFQISKGITKGAKEHKG